MENLLFLTHRIPYPPSKGDKIRAFHILRHLARTHRVFLGTFVDDPADRRHVAELSRWCEGVCAVPIDPRLRRLRALSGLVRGEALSLPYYRHRRLKAWVERTLARERVTRALAFSSPMAQYLLGARFEGVRRIMDFVDVDSEKWRAYGARHGRMRGAIYRREGRRLLAFERRVAAAFDASVFVTAAEARLFRELAPEAAGRVAHVENGVDSHYFSPDAHYPSPYPAAERALVFTGAMDYWANADAVVWFAREVLPEVRASIPDAVFYVVGARPTDAVTALARLAGVRVTGAVDDVRPYLAHAVAAVAPLRIARGLQNKVLEAMAMAKPVLATRAAMDGIRAGDPLYRLVSDDASVLARLAIELMSEPALAELGTLGRELVLRHYAWERNLERFEALLHDRLGWEGERPAPDALGGGYGPALQERLS